MLNSLNLAPTQIHAFQRQQNETTPPPPKNGQVSISLGVLECEIEQQAKLIQTLLDTLNPIISKVPFEENCSKEDKENLVGLADRLRNDCKVIQRNNQILLYLMNNCQL